MVVGRKGSGLHHKHIFTTHILVDFGEHFLIRKALDAGVGQGQAKIIRNALGEGWV
jgi:hypothetical protein